MGLSKFCNIDYHKDKEERFKKAKAELSKDIPEDKATHIAEQEIYKPTELEAPPVFGDKGSGMLIGIRFFVNKEEFERVKEIFKVIQREEEFMIAGSAIEKFKEVILDA